MELSKEPSKFVVLWVNWGDESSAAFYEGLNNHTWSLFKSEGSKAMSLLPSLEAAVVIVEVDHPSVQAIAFMSQLNELWPHISQILFVNRFKSPSEEVEFVSQAVNSVGVRKIINGQCEHDSFDGYVKMAIDSYVKKKEQNRVHQEVKLQNARLEEMTNGLELLVAERTKHLALAKSQVEGKIAGMRGLIQIIKDLSSLVATEDLLALLRNDLKPFHQIKHLCLAYVTPDNGQRILYYQGQTIVGRTVTYLWPQGLRIRINEIDDSQYLANEFSRPFGKTISIPILIKKEDEKVPCSAVLFFEHTFIREDAENFLSYIGERLQPLSLTFDRIQLEDQVNSASFMWEKTFDGVQDPIAILDLDYNLLRSNRSFASEQAGRCFQRFAARESICEGCPVKSVLESGQPQVGQVKKGSKVFEVHSYPINLFEGAKPTIVVNHYVDVTLSQELQGKVVQHEKMVAIGHLAGNIAHELNNPLTGIRSLSQILINEAEEGSHRKNDLIEVERAASRCQSIVSNLLEFSKGGSLKNLTRVSLNQVISKTLPFLKTAMRSYNCEIQLCDEEPWVVVEPQLLQQVVFNLVNNACQAMSDEGTIRIETNIFRHENMPKVRLSVRDTGSGIPDNIIKNVFDPFFTTKSEGQGTGLGLSMSRGIVESLEGKIWVESVVGEGTAFFIELPLV